MFPYGFNKFFLFNIISLIQHNIIFTTILTPLQKPVSSKIVMEGESTKQATKVKISHL